MSKFKTRARKETYARSEICGFIERQLDMTVGKPPSLAVEQWLAARILLEMNGSPGGSTGDYFKTAHDLAQQRIYEDVDPEQSVDTELENASPMEVDFAAPLMIVKQALGQRGGQPISPSQAGRIGC